MGAAIDALLRRLTRSGFRRAMGGEHWAWFVIAGAAFVLRRARHPDDAVARLDLSTLEPGQRYVIDLVDGRTARRGDRVR